MKRTHELIALALDPRASATEAGVLALMACRHIRDAGLLVDVNPKPKLIEAKYSGVCSGCGSPFAVGAKVAWTRGQSPKCEACVNA